MEERLIQEISRLEEDNSNLRLLDQSLRRNTAVFQALLANSVDGIALTGADRRILRVVHGLTGIAPEELIGTPIELVCIPEDRHIFPECYGQLLSGRCRKVEFEVRVFRPDESIMCLSGTLTDMLDDPNVQAIVCNYADVSHRKHGEVTLAEFSAIVQSAECSIFSKDSEGMILSWNDGARRMFGYAEDEIVGRHIGKLVPDSLRGEEETTRRLLVEKGAATELKTVRLAKDGTLIPVLIELAPIRDKSGHIRGILHLSRRIPLPSIP